MMNTIICIVNNLFRVYLTLSCVKLFFEEEKVSSLKEVAVYSIFYISNTFLYLLFYSPVINIAVNLLGIASFAFLYTRSVKKIVFITGIVYGIAICCDSIAVLPFSDYQIGEEVNQLYAVVSVFLFFICRILLEKILSFRKKNTKVENLPLVLVPVCSIALFCFLAFGGDRWDARMVGTSAGLLLINFLVLYLYNLLLKAFAQKYNNELLEQRVYAYQN